MSKKRLYLWFLIFWFLFIPLTLQASKGVKKVGPKNLPETTATSLQVSKGVKKAKTVDELIAMYDSSDCMSCHADIAEQWQKSLHARSIFGTGRTIATILTTFKGGT